MTRQWMGWVGWLATIAGWLLASAVGSALFQAFSLAAGEIPSYVVHEFRFKGNQVCTTTELARLVQSFLNRPLTMMDLEAARVALTRYYVDKGYINSGAVLEELPTAEGVATFKIVEGKLTEVTVRGNRWVREGFYRRRAQLAAGDPLNANRLRTALQGWREYYGIDQVNAELRPGVLPGQAVLNLAVKEPLPVHGGLEYANDKPPSTGAEQITALLRADSLTGYGDRLSLNYGIARSVEPGMTRGKFLGIDDLGVAYERPLTVRDTSLGVQYVRNSASVLEAPFDQLDIRSQSEVYGVSLAQPVYRTPTREFKLSLAGEHKRNQTSLLGFPYSFSPGAVNGKSVVSALRLSSEYVDRSEKHVLAARLTLSAGMDVFGATDNSTGPDGKFFSVLGQAQYLRRLWNTRNEVFFRVAGQYSPDPLLALEQFPIGGAHSVRGYRENTLVRDSGLFGVMEFHLPVVSTREKRPLLQLAPFASVGAGWDHDNTASQVDEISSAGMGLIFTPHRKVEASLFWGHAFRDLHYVNHNLQDDGVHFRLQVWAF